MKFWKKLSISYKLFISLLIVISIGQLFIMVYIWKYESKILTQKEYKDLEFSLENEAQKLLKNLQIKQKESKFLASLEVMDDLIAKDIDKRVSNMLKRKADDLKENIILQAISNKTIIASSLTVDIGKVFQKDRKNYLYFEAPIRSSFNPKIELGEIALLYPYKNLTNLHTSQNRVLWISPLENKDINTKDYLIVSKSLKDKLSGYTINLAYKKSKAFETINHIQKILFYSFLLALSLLAFVVFIISKNLLKGVKELSKTSKEILKTEDYTKQVIVDSEDEIGELSNSFNTLISQTDTLITKLDKQSKLHLNNLIELITFFNTITKTKDAKTTKQVAQLSLKNFSNHDKRFLDATENMISLQLERISLFDKTHKALEAKKMFLSTISHELKTPLGSILNLTQHLMISKNLNDEDIKMLSKIESSATHLLALINNILDISKLESNSLIVHPQKVNLHLLFEEIIDMIEPLIYEKGLKLIKRIELKQKIIQTDTQLFKQVVINLLSNAIKYTDKGSITITLKDNSLQITDTGIGIDTKLLPHIFEEFYQSSVEIKNLGKSSGLGLALSKKIAILLGGDLRVKSDGKNRGVTAIFTF